MKIRKPMLCPNKLLGAFKTEHRIIYQLSMKENNALVTKLKV